MANRIPKLTKRAVEALNPLALANGWRLARRRLMGGNRVEIEGPADTDLPALRRMGCTVEIVSWRTRVFVPNAEAIERILDRWPPDYPQRHPRAAARWDTYCRPGGGRTRRTVRKAPMTAQTLPDCPNFCFVPAYDVEDEVQQIRIVIEGMAGHVPTALVALTSDDALSIYDKLNRHLGYDREAWTSMAAASMYAVDDDPDNGAWH